MGFLKTIFFGKTPEEYEEDGDALLRKKKWGEARLAFAKALEKLEKDPVRQKALGNRIEGKLSEAAEALARQHLENALELIESDCLEDARDLFSLASELTKDQGLKDELEGHASKLEQRLEREYEERLPEFDYEPGKEDRQENFVEERSERQAMENFRALIGALPKDVRKQYVGYGPKFIEGYIALNEGQFETAVEYLSESMEDHRDDTGYIPLELATALMNLDRLEEAEKLLERFLESHPETLNAYRLLCEIYWDLEDYESAHAILDTAPRDRIDTVALDLLKGETLYHQGIFAEADALYSANLQEHGWNEAVAQALAKTSEATGDWGRARDLYREMMSSCGSCGARVDPYVKKKFADASFAAGERTPSLLELYLSVARQLPEAAPACFEKASLLYKESGNETEAKRCKAISSRLKFGLMGRDSSD